MIDYLVFFVCIPYAVNVSGANTLIRAKKAGPRSEILRSLGIVIMSGDDIYYSAQTAGL